MAQSDYQIVVIGSGPGGYVAAIRAVQLGFKTACVEKSQTLGGTCLNVGCIPSKALLQSSEYYELVAHNLDSHGLSFDHLNIDFSKMMKRKDDIVKSLVESVGHLFQRNQVNRLIGSARFLDPHTLEISKDQEKQKISADHFIIATGSEPTPLPFLPFDEKQILSSTGSLALATVPKSLLVIGAGAIGLELASVYHRLGSKVVIVEMLDRVSPAMDAAISKDLLRVLKKQGLEFYLSAQVVSLKGEADKVSLEILQNHQKQNLSAEKVLVSIGRRPYTQGLGLKEIGIRLTPKGFIEVDSRFRTSQSHIYAIGDVIEGVMLAHKASEEGYVAVEVIAGRNLEINYMAIPNVIYTHPEAASVGLTEEEAIRAGLELKRGISFFKGNARARCAGDTEGFVKILGESRSGLLLGMHILGAHASELIHTGVYAMQKGMTLEEIASTSHAHPTLAESIKEAALQALGRPIH